MKIRISLVSTLLFLTRAALALELDRACITRNLQLLFLDQQLSGEVAALGGLDDSVMKPLSTVIERRRAAGQPTPELTWHPDGKKWYRNWSAEQTVQLNWSKNPALKNAPKYGSAKTPLTLTQVGHYDSPTYIVEIDQTKHIFRPADTREIPGAVIKDPETLARKGMGTPSSTTAARRTIAASALDEALFAKVVTRSRAVYVNGVPGSLSEFVYNGVEVGTGAASKLNPKHEANWRNIQSIEFLTGNAYSHGENYLKDFHGVYHGIGYDQAFIPGVPRINDKTPPSFTRESLKDPSWHASRQVDVDKYLDIYYFSRRLPEKYTPEFLGNLKKLDSPKLRTLLSSHLTPQEIEGVILRREIILADAESRGHLAIFQRPEIPAKQAAEPKDLALTPSEPHKVFTSNPSLNLDGPYPYASFWPRENPFARALASGQNEEELRGLAFHALSRDSNLPTELRSLATRYKSGRQTELTAFGMPGDELSHSAAEFLLGAQDVPKKEAKVRKALLQLIGEHPRSDGRTIDLLLPISRGSRYADPAENGLATEAIQKITARVGNYPPRSAAPKARTDISDSLLHEPIESIERMGTVSNNGTFLMKLKNGMQGVLKPRTGEGNFVGGTVVRADKVRFARESQAYRFVEDTLGNTRSRETGASRVFVPVTVETSPVHAGKAYGPSSVQFFADGFIPLADFKAVHPDLWKKIERSNQWIETKNRIQIMDYATGNLDRFQNMANRFRPYKRQNMNNIMVPRNLKDPKDLQVALIDNGIGRPGIPEFTMKYVPKARDFPPDLAKQIRNFDPVKFRRDYATSMSHDGIEDTVQRMANLKKRLMDWERSQVK